jgi:hypothetical protein
MLRDKTKISIQSPFGVWGKFEILDYGMLKQSDSYWDSMTSSLSLRPLRCISSAFSAVKCI